MKVGKSKIYFSTLSPEWRKRFTPTEFILYNLLLNYSIQKIDGAFDYKEKHLDIDVIRRAVYPKIPQGDNGYYGFIPLEEPQQIEDWLGINAQVIERAKKNLCDNNWIHLKEYKILIPKSILFGSMAYFTYYLPPVDMKPQRAIILNWLINKKAYCNKNHSQMEIKTETIAKSLAIPTNTVRDALQDFKRLGLIKTKQLQNKTRFIDIPLKTIGNSNRLRFANDTDNTEEEAETLARPDEQRRIQAEQAEREAREAEAELKRKSQIHDVGGGNFETLFEAIRHNFNKGYILPECNDVDKYISYCKECFAGFTDEETIKNANVSASERKQIQRDLDIYCSEK